MAAAFFLMLAAAGPASAHATLERTDPDDGAVLATQPSEVSAQFDENVGVSADSLRVYSPTGVRVDDGNTGFGGQDSIIIVNLRPNLAKGTYTVAWHVISADTHPVSGAFTFSIGVPSRTTVNPNTIITRASQAEGVLFGIARWASYLSYALLTGTVVFLALCWPAGARNRSAPDPQAARGTPGKQAAQGKQAGQAKQTVEGKQTAQGKQTTASGWRDPSRRVFHLIAAGWTVLLASSLAELLLQGVYASGLPMSRAVDPSVIQVTLHSRFGTAIEIRLLLLAVAAPFLAVGIRRIGEMTLRQRLRTAAVALVYTMALAATWAAVGHASTGIQVPIASVSDVLHLTSMAVWLGGLATLAYAVLPDPARPREAARAIVRFSNIALTCVSVLIVSGTYQAWRDVGSINALLGSSYGRLVLLKIMGLLALIGLGYFARTLIALGLGVKAAAALAEPDEVTTAEPANAAAEPASAAAAQTDSRTTGRKVAAAAQPPHRPRVESGAMARHPGRRTSRVGPRPRPAKQASSARDAVTAATLRRLRWSVTAETAIVLGVLAVTSVLVDSVPGRTASGLADLPGATDVSVNFNTGTVSGTALVLVEPGTLGPNQAHVLFENAQGNPYTPAQVTMQFELPSKSIGPLAATVSQDGPGHFLCQPVVLGFTGKWELIMTVRSDTFDETTLYIPVNVSGSSAGGS